MNSVASNLEPEPIAAPAGDIRFLFLPGRDLFNCRAARFRYLAVDHHLGAYLIFLALLAEAQQTALEQFLAPSLPNHDEQFLCRSHGMPLLGARSWRRDPAWREGLALILEQMKAAALPAAARNAINCLAHAGDVVLEEMADRILAGDLDAVSPQKLPFVAAALQVYWVRMAALLGEKAFGRLEVAGVCPVCGSYPNAGVVHGGGPEQGLRYLSCSLCATRWHMVRITCSNCAATDGIDYYTLDGASGAVKAESCAGCGTYLKLLYLEKDGWMETVADDLATLDLDNLLADVGKVRCGPNLLLHPGTP